MKIAIDFRTPASAAMWRISAGVADYAAANPDVQIVFAHSSFGPNAGIAAADCDAVIVYSPRADLSMPQVAVSSTAPADCIRVGVDEAKIADLVVTHFVSMGLRHLALFGDKNGEMSDIRWGCFSATVNRHGAEATFISCADDSIVPLVGLPKPAGIMAVNDDFGRLLMTRCRRAGLRVPGEINVIGVDNLPDPTSSSKTLASVSIPFAHLGYHAARLCVELIAGKAVESVLVPPTGIVLGDSLTMPGSEMNTAAAVAHFMRMNIGALIEMEDLVRQSNLSRRRLEQVFRSAYGSSPMAYLKELRLERAKHLLKTDTGSLKKIVGAAGYRDVNHLCRVFREQLGTTPLRYRENGKGIGDGT